MPFYTRPRPSRCLIHPSEACRQCHLCLESASWSLEHYYAHRLASIQFEGHDPVDADGDVVPSSVERYRPTNDPDEMDDPRDAALIYELRPCLVDILRAAPEQGTGGEPGAPFSFVPAGPKTPNARVLLVGNVKSTGPHAGPSPAETGEGRILDPPVLEMSSDESEDEGVPKRGVSAPPPSVNLRRGGIAPKSDIGWKENKALFRRFGHPNARSDHASRSPVATGSYDSLGPTRLHLEIVSASAMPGVNSDRNYGVSPSLDIVKQLPQSVEQLSLRLDTGGWVLVADFASKLGTATDELITVGFRNFIVCFWDAW